MTVRERHPLGLNGQFELVHWQVKSVKGKVTQSFKIMGRRTLLNVTDLRPDSSTYGRVLQISISEEEDRKIKDDIYHSAGVLDCSKTLFSRQTSRYLIVLITIPAKPSTGCMNSRPAGGRRDIKIKHSSNLAQEEPAFQI